MQRPGLDSPSQRVESPSRAAFDDRTAARLAAAEEEAEILRKQVDLLQRQQEAAAATPVPADSGAQSLVADLSAARARITQLEEQLRHATTAAPTNAAHAVSGGAKRRTTGGWEDLLEIPEDQRGQPPTPEQLALLQEQMHKLLEEREGAEKQLKSLASQLGSRTGADAADAGDMSSLKRYWRENERLQREKAAVEAKLKRMAVIPGIGMPRTLAGADSFGSGSSTAAAVGSAVADGRVDAMAVSLQRAEAEMRRVTAERDGLQRRLDEQAKQAAESITSAAGTARGSSSPVETDADGAAGPSSDRRPSSAGSAGGAITPLREVHVRQLKADMTAAQEAAVELRQENEQLRHAVSTFATQGAAENDATIKLGIAQQEAEQLRRENAALRQQQEASAPAAADSSTAGVVAAAPGESDAVSRADMDAAVAQAMALQDDKEALSSRVQDLEAQLAILTAAAGKQNAVETSGDSGATATGVFADNASLQEQLRELEAELQRRQATDAASSAQDSSAELEELRKETEHLRFANEGLEAQLAQLTTSGMAMGQQNPSAQPQGSGDVEVELLRHELEDLRHDNCEMEANFHEAAAQLEKECADRVAELEAALATAKAEVEEAQKDAAAFAQDLADHLSRTGGSSGGGTSAAERAALKQAQAEAVAARKEVEWLTQQLAALQGGSASADADTAGSDQDAMTDPLAADGANGATAPTLERHNSGAQPAAGWMSDSRWSALRRRGEAAGWLVDPSQVELGSVLGEGSFGTTYKGRWRGAECAVKVVRISKPDEANSFLREVEALSLLRHPNIMPFYGATLRPPAQCWLVCEFLPNGTLSEWLYGANADPRASASMWQPKHSLGARLEMALGVARGMAAMEAANPPLMHRDLKPTNIFLDAGGAARVADMGLARHLTPGCGPDLTGETGTYYYMAPEVIRHEIYDTSADVYSWGVLFVELLTARPPYGDQYLTPVQVAIAVGDDKLRPTMPKNLPAGLAALARACFDGEPGARPSFQSIVEQLSPLVADIESQEAAAGGNSSNSVFGRLFGSGAGGGGGSKVPHPHVPHGHHGNAAAQ